MATREQIKARINKKDEFYTQITDIEKELKYYREHFRDKVVLCNCDDPRISNFFKYFALSFKVLGLKKLIATCYKSLNFDLFSQNDSEKAIYAEYNGVNDADHIPSDEELDFKYFRGDGDFRSAECIELLKQADIVVTNPPFSLFREYVAQLIQYDKKFIILGNMNAISYKEIFSLFQQNKIWLGASIHSGDREFGVPMDYPLAASGCRLDENGNKFIRVKGVRWFTNLEYKNRREDLILVKKYRPSEYPTYDNYDAINVDKVYEIPCDFNGIIGVPITFLDKYNPEQFEILGVADRNNTSGLRTKVYTVEDAPNYNDLNRSSVIKTGDSYKTTYTRIFIRYIKKDR